MSVTGDQFDGTFGHYEEGHNMLYERISDAWRDMRGSTRRLIREKPSEARLLFYVLMSDMIFFLSWSIKTVVAPYQGPGDQVPLEVAFWLMVAFCMRTAILYLFSTVLGSALRIMGGHGAWRETRTAVFWGALVAAPFGFLLALVSAAFNMLSPVIPTLGTDAIALLPYWISIMPFLWYISAGLAEAHGFENTTTVFLCMLGVSLLFVLTGMYALSTLL